MRGARASAVVLTVLVAFLLSTTEREETDRGDPRAWDLVQQFHSEDQDAVDDARWELYQMGESAAPALISMLRPNCSATSGHAQNLLDALGMEAIPHLQRGLRDENSAVRAACALWFAVVGFLREQPGELEDAARVAIPDLVDLLHDEESWVAEYAAGGLANLLQPGDTDVIPILAEAMKQPSSPDTEGESRAKPLDRYRFARALAAIGPATVPAFQALLQEDLLEVREAALMGLRDLGPDAAPAVPHIIEIIESQLDAGPGAVQLDTILPAATRTRSSENSSESLAAARYIPLLFEASQALAAIGEKALPAAPVLRRWVRDPLYPRRWQAIHALGKIRDESPETIALLIEALEEDEIDYRAVTSLASIGPAAVPELLRSAMRPATRAEAIRALGLMDFDGPEARDVLLAALEETAPEVRCDAAAALWRIGYEARSALPVLADHCDRHREALRKPGSGALDAIPELMARFERQPSNYDIASALAKLGEPALPYLIDALQHARSDVRSRAAWTLDNTKANLEPALFPLVRALRDQDDGVRLNAVHALRRLGRQAAPAIHELVDTLEQEDDFYNWRVLVQVIVSTGEAADAAVPALNQALESESFSKRQVAHQALERILQ